MIVHVLSGWLASYPIRRAFLQHITWRVSLKSAINKRNSSSTCHFPWRNGLIAAWIFVHPTNTTVILDLKGFLINQKLFLSISEYHYYYQGRKWNMFDFNFWNRHNLSLQFISSFEAAALSFTNLFFPPSCFSLLSSGRSFCCLPHFAPTASRKKPVAKKFSALSTMWNTRVDWRLV